MFPGGIDSQCFLIGSRGSSGGPLGDVGLGLAVEDGLCSAQQLLPALSTCDLGKVTRSKSSGAYFLSFKMRAGSFQPPGGREEFTDVCTDERFHPKTQSHVDLQGTGVHSGSSVTIFVLIKEQVLSKSSMPPTGENKFPSPVFM